MRLTRSAGVAEGQPEPGRIVLGGRTARAYSEFEPAPAEYVQVWRSPTPPRRECAAALAST